MKEGKKIELYFTYHYVFDFFEDTKWKINHLIDDRNVHTN